jgi:hypothetical protein
MQQQQQPAKQTLSMHAPFTVSHIVPLCLDDEKSLRAESTEDSCFFLTSLTAPDNRFIESTLGK